MTGPYVDTPKRTLRTSVTQAAPSLIDILRAGLASEPATIAGHGLDAVGKHAQANARTASPVQNPATSPNLQDIRTEDRPGFDNTQLGQLLGRYNNLGQQGREDLKMGMVTEMALGMVADPLSPALTVAGKSGLYASKLAELIGILPVIKTGNRVQYPLRVNAVKDGPEFLTKLDGVYQEGMSIFGIEGLGDVGGLRTVTRPVGQTKVSSTTGTLGFKGQKEVMDKVRQDFPAVEYFDFRRAGGAVKGRKMSGVDYTGPRARAIYSDPRNPEELERLIKYRQRMRNEEVVSYEQAHSGGLVPLDEFPQFEPLDNITLSDHGTDITDDAMNDVHKLGVISRTHPNSGPVNIDGAIDRAIETQQYQHQGRYTPEDINRFRERARAEIEWMTTERPVWLTPEGIQLPGEIQMTQSGQLYRNPMIPALKTRTFPDNLPPQSLLIEEAVLVDSAKAELHMRGELGEITNMDDAVRDTVNKAIAKRNIELGFRYTDDDFAGVTEYVDNQVNQWIADGGMNVQNLEETTNPSWHLDTSPPTSTAPHMPGFDRPTESFRSSSEPNLVGNISIELNDAIVEPVSSLSTSVNTLPTLSTASLTSPSDLDRFLEATETRIHEIAAQALDRWSPDNPLSNDYYLSPTNAIARALLADQMYYGFRYPPFMLERIFNRVMATMTNP